MHACVRIGYILSLTHTPLVRIIASIYILIQMRSQNELHTYFHLYWSEMVFGIDIIRMGKIK